MVLDRRARPRLLALAQAQARWIDEGRHGTIVRPPVAAGCLTLRAPAAGPRRRLIGCGRLGRQPASPRRARAGRRPSGRCRPRRCRPRPGWHRPSRPRTPIGPTPAALPNRAAGPRRGRRRRSTGPSRPPRAGRPGEMQLALVRAVEHAAQDRRAEGGPELDDRLEQGRPDAAALGRQLDQCGRGGRGEADAAAGPHDEGPDRDDRRRRSWRSCSPRGAMPTTVMANPAATVTLAPTRAAIRSAGTAPSDQPGDHRQQADAGALRIEPGDRLRGTAAGRTGRRTGRGRRTRSGSRPRRSCASAKRPRSMSGCASGRPVRRRSQAKKMVSRTRPATAGTSARAAAPAVLARLHDAVHEGHETAAREQRHRPCRRPAPPEHATRARAG